MAKTEYVFVQGKTKWFRHLTPEIFGNESRWKHTLYPTPESLEVIRELQAEGIKNVLKKDEDGYYINFSRPTQLKRRDGAIVPLVPPEVTDAEGNILKNTMVGNGSDVTTKLEVYQHKTPGGGTAKAARWFASRIDTLVPFETNSMKEDELKSVEGFDKNPAIRF